MIDAWYCFRHSNTVLCKTLDSASKSNVLSIKPFTAILILFSFPGNNSVEILKIGKYKKSALQLYKTVRDLDIKLDQRDEVWEQKHKINTFVQEGLFSYWLSFISK